MRGRLPDISVESLLADAPDEITRGAFTNIWKKKEDFERDLVAYLADHREFPGARTLSKHVLSLAESGAELSLLVKVGAECTLQEITSSPSWRLVVALVAMLDDDDVGPIVRAQLQTSNRKFDDQSAQLYRFLLMGHRRRMRPGLDVLDLATALGALITGLGLRALIDPDRVQTTINWAGDSDWSLAGVAAQAIVEYFTEDLTPLDS